MNTVIKYLLPLYLSLFASTTFGQKYDYHVIHKSIDFGSGIHMSYVDSTADLRFEVFDWDGKATSAPTLSDKNGNLLGYYNASRLYDSIGRMAINGDSLYYGYTESLFYHWRSKDFGLAQQNNAGFIPITDSLFYLFHQNSEWYNETPNYKVDIEDNGHVLSSYSDGLHLTKVRLNKAGRLYIRPEEKKIRLVDDLLVFSQMAFCKHANGKDWWIISPKTTGPEAYTILLKDSTIADIRLQYLSQGNTKLSTGSGVSFSPDGSKFVRFIYRYADNLSPILEVYNFDRCEGILDSVDSYASFELSDNFTTYGNIEFSESGRFLYVAMGEYILQYDFEKPGYITEPDTIGIWDGFLYTNFIPTLFDSFMRLPNGKILVSSYVNTPYLHYIHEPDQPGKSCQFEQRALMMPYDSLNEPFYIDFEALPEFPPYRMPASDVDCTTSTSDISDQVQISIFPNPTYGQLHIRHAIGYTASIYDISGRVVRDGILLDDNMQSIWIDDLASGMYVCMYVCMYVLYLNQSNYPGLTYKFVKQ